MDWAALAVETLPAGIWAKIRIDPVTGCWLWDGYKDADGYGSCTVDGKSYLVHRFVYTMLVDPIPHKWVLDHLLADRPVAPGPCVHGPNCCNPTHVEPVTVEINLARMVPWNRRKTHCPQGHDYATQGKSYPCKDGHTRRFCNTCNKLKKAAGKDGHPPTLLPTLRQGVRCLEIHLYHRQLGGRQPQ